MPNNPIFTVAEVFALQDLRRMLIRRLGDFNAVERAEMDRLLRLFNSALTKMEDHCDGPKR
jgi:hypothetical protein